MPCAPAGAAADGGGGASAGAGGRPDNCFTAAGASSGADWLRSGTSNSTVRSRLTTTEPAPTSRCRRIAGTVSRETVLSRMAGPPGS